MTSLLQELQLLSEMPQSIEPTEFDLTDAETNERMALSFVREHDEESTLYKSPDREIKLFQRGNQLVAVDLAKSRIVYFVRWIEHFYKLVGSQACTQVAVWRDRFVAFNGSSKLAKIVFFDYLLPRTGVIITDLMQTPDGQGFWMRRIDDAFNEGLNVYYVNLLQDARGVKQTLKRVSSNDDLDKIIVKHEPWGPVEKHQARKFVISNKILQEQ